MSPAGDRNDDGTAIVTGNRMSKLEMSSVEMRMCQSNDGRVSGWKVIGGNCV